MPAPETTVTLTLEKPGDQYHAKVLVKHDFTSHVDEHAHEGDFDTPEQATEWARSVMRTAGAESLRVLNRTGEKLNKTGRVH